MPASTGRIGIRYSVPPISAAVRKPFCPTSVLMNTIGNGEREHKPKLRPTIARMTAR